MADEERWLVWEFFPLSSSSGIVLLLKVAGAVTLILRSHKPENEEKSTAHKIRLIAREMRQKLRIQPPGGMGYKLAF